MRGTGLVSVNGAWVYAYFTTDAGSFTTTANDIVVNPAAASLLVVTTQPSPTATAGVAFATQPAITAKDAFGNIVTNDSSHTVTAARGNHGSAGLQGAKLPVSGRTSSGSAPSML